MYTREQLDMAFAALSDRLVERTVDATVVLFGDAAMMFGFDARAEWLVILTRNGFPHALSPEDGSAEVLPRAVIEGRHVLKQVTAILPVTGGVVLCGVVPHPKGETDNIHVAAHYDLQNRTVRAFDFGQVTGVAVWVSFRDIHCVVLRAGAVPQHLPGDCVAEQHRAGVARDDASPTTEGEQAAVLDYRAAGQIPPLTADGSGAITDQYPTLLGTGAHHQCTLCLQSGDGQRAA